MASANAVDTWRVIQGSAETTSTVSWKVSWGNLRNSQNIGDCLRVRLTLRFKSLPLWLASRVNGCFGYKSFDGYRYDGMAQEDFG